MYNRELQVIDTQEKAYLLGFFYADGNVGNGRVQCRIDIQLNDKDLVFRLKELFPFFYIHYDRGTKIEIGNYRKEFQQDLIQNGCLPRKSFENRNNIHVPNIPEELIPHFIRGYFDGDGGCTLSFNSKKIQKRVYIYSASENLLNEVHDILLNNGIQSTITGKMGKKIPVFKLCIRTSSYESFYRYLYDTATIFLLRKKEKFDKIMQTKFFIQKEAPVCKFCNSNNTVCDGFTYYKVKRQNYLCKDCKRHFTAPLNSNI